MSTTRNQFPKVVNSNEVLLDGYAPILSSDHSVVLPFASGNTCSGFSVAYASSAGLYDITLDQAYNAYLGCHVQVESPTTRSALVGQVVYHNVTGTTLTQGATTLTAKTIRVVFLSGTTPTELPADAGMSISLKLKDSVLKPGS